LAFGLIKPLTSCAQGPLFSVQSSCIIIMTTHINLISRLQAYMGSITVTYSWQEQLTIKQGIKTINYKTVIKSWVTIVLYMYIHTNIILFYTERGWYLLKHTASAVSIMFSCLGVMAILNGKQGQFKEAPKHVTYGPFIDIPVVYMHPCSWSAVSTSVRKILLSQYVLSQLPLPPLGPRHRFCNMYIVSPSACWICWHDGLLEVCH